MAECGVWLLFTVFFFHDILGEIGREQVFVDGVDRKLLFLDFKKIHLGMSIVLVNNSNFLDSFNLGETELEKVLADDLDKSF